MLRHFTSFDENLPGAHNTAAQNAYTSMGQSLRMNEHELNDYNAYGHWLGLEISQQDWKDGATLSPAQLNTLNNLVDNYWMHRAGQKAMSYMNRHMGTNFYIPPARGDWQPRRASLDYLMLAEQEAIKVYPNPADQELNIQILYKGRGGSGTFTIYDISGRQVYSLNTNQDNGLINIDTRTWQSGMYFYELIINGEKHQGKIEILH